MLVIMAMVSLVNWKSTVSTNRAFAARTLNAYKQLRDCNVSVILVSLEMGPSVPNRQALNRVSCCSVKVLQLFEFHLMVNEDSQFLCQMLVLEMVQRCSLLYKNLFVFFVYVDGDRFG